MVISAADLPTITPDEYGSWAVARFLAGHDSLVLMQDMPQYPLVPGAVVAPITLLPIGPVAGYRLSLVVLSLFTVVAAVLLRRVVSMLSPDRSVLAAAAFAVVLLWPATMVTGSFTWAEPTVVLGWAALTWAVVTMWTTATRRSLTSALVVGSVVAGAAPFVHGRLTAAPVVWLVAVAAAARAGSPGADERPRRRALDAAMCVLIVVSVGGAGRWLEQTVTGALWSDAASNGMPTIVDSLLVFEFWRSLCIAALGQLWYLVVSSFGLAVFGVLWLVETVRRPARPGLRGAALTVAALASSNLAISAVATGTGVFGAVTGTTDAITGMRWDHLIYGRYNDVVALVLVVLGLVWLWSVPARQLVVRIAGAAAVGCVAVAVLLDRYGAGLHANDFLLPTIAGVSIVPADRSGLPVLWWTLWGLAALGVVVVSAARGRQVLLGAVGALVVVACLLGARQAAVLQNDRSAPVLVDTVGAPPHPGAIVTIAADTAHLPYLRFGVFAQQHQFAHEGWQFEFSELDSEALADDVALARPGSAASPETANLPDVVVLTDPEAPPGDDWEAVAEFEGATFWRRD